MEQTNDHVPAAQNPEQAERLLVAAQIASAYPDLSGRPVPVSPALDGSAYPAAPPARQAAQVESLPKTCPRCGDSNLTTDRFCRRCGSPLALPAAQASTAPAYPAAAAGQYDRPGSYIDRRLLPGEQILFRTRLHWTQIISALVSLVVGLAIFWFYQDIAALPASMASPTARPGQTIMDVYPDGVLFFYFIAFVFGLSGLQIFIRWAISDLALTDQRLLGRYGTLFSKPVDIALADISLVKYSRFSIPNQGTITVGCVPRRFYIFRWVPRPKEFRQRLDAMLPAVRTPLDRVRWGLWVPLIFLMVLLGIAVVLFIAFYFTGGRELMMPRVEVNFSTISQYPDQRHVTIEGYLDFPNSVQCDTDCGVGLVDYANPELDLPVFISVPDYGEPVGPNQMERLPSTSETDECRVHLDNGVIVGDGAAVRLTGKICHTIQYNYLCIDGITLIEAGHPPVP
jgi:hypothetical protein